MRYQTDKGLIRLADGCIRFSGDAPLGVLLSSMCQSKQQTRDEWQGSKPGPKRNSGLMGRILPVMSGQPLSVREIAAAAGLSHYEMLRSRSLMALGVKRGELVRVDVGVYALAGVPLKPHKPKPRYQGHKAKMMQVIGAEPVSCGNVVRALGLATTRKHKRMVASYLALMCKNGDLTRSGYGMYAANSNAEVPTRGAKGCGGVSVRGGAVKGGRR